jgi:hypothetical protein
MFSRVHACRRAAGLSIMKFLFGGGGVFAGRSASLRKDLFFAHGSFIAVR